MKILPIVEGYGEGDAVPLLLRRLIAASNAHALEAGRAIRRKRHELVQEGPLRKAIRLALLQRDCAGELVILDADDDCPKDLAPVLEGWARQEAGCVPCAVVMATREYEAWFLAAADSLRGLRGIRADASPPCDPEAPRGAKEKLEELMEGGCTNSETADQAPLTASLDLGTAFQRSRSFRRLVTAFGHVARRAGVELADWPPPRWRLPGP